MEAKKELQLLKEKFKSCKEVYQKAQVAYDKAVDAYADAKIAWARTWVDYDNARREYKARCSSKEEKGVNDENYLLHNRDRRSDIRGNG